MPTKGMSLRMIKDVIRLKFQAKLSHEQIASTLAISKGAVAKYVSLASAAGLDWETVQAWSEQQLATALQPRAAASQPFVEPDWSRVHRELDRKGMTLMLLWQEYVAAHPEGRTWRYTQFCEHYKAFAKTLKRSMRQHRLAGEKLFIDFAGSTVPLAGGARAQVWAMPRVRLVLPDPASQLSAVQPILGANETMAAHCDSCCGWLSATIPTAPSMTSGENFFDFVTAPSQV